MAVEYARLIQQGAIGYLFRCRGNSGRRRSVWRVVVYGGATHERDRCTRRLGSERARGAEACDVAGLEADADWDRYWLDRIDRAEKYGRRTALRYEDNRVLKVRSGDHRPGSCGVYRVLDSRSACNQSGSYHRAAMPFNGSRIRKTDTTRCYWVSFPVSR